MGSFISMHIYGDVSKRLFLIKNIKTFSLGHFKVEALQTILTLVVLNSHTSLSLFGQVQ